VVEERGLVRNGRKLKPGARIRLSQADADVLLGRSDQARPRQGQARGRRRGGLMDAGLLDRRLKLLARNDTQERTYGTKTATWPELSRPFGPRSMRPCLPAATGSTTS
jgi:hypothetical protein